MTAWRTYADPPWTDPELTRLDRRSQGRDRRAAMHFAEALATGGTGFVVWMCADSLDAVDNGDAVALDAVHVDDAAPGPWEWDLLDLAATVADDGAKAVEALAEAYRQAIMGLADEPLHSVRSTALRRARRLADGVPVRSAQSADTAVRRLVSSTATLRPDRLARHWGSDVAVCDVSQEIAQYRESLPEGTALLLAQYRVRDALACLDGRIMTLMTRGSDAEDVVLLEGAPAGPSPREPAVGAWRGGSDVQRVLLARETVPLVPGELTGWSTSADGATARAWSRARMSQQSPHLGGARKRARRLGAVLGVLHSTGSDAAMLAGYLGQSPRFVKAVREAVLSASGANVRSA
jgi:hypothetical protein